MGEDTVNMCEVTVQRFEITVNICKDTVQKCEVAGVYQLLVVTMCGTFTVEIHALRCIPPREVSAETG